MCFDQKSIPKNIIQILWPKDWETTEISSTLSIWIIWPWIGWTDSHPIRQVIICRRCNHQWRPVIPSELSVRRRLMDHVPLALRPSGDLTSVVNHLIKRCVIRSLIRTNYISSIFSNYYFWNILFIVTIITVWKFCEMYHRRKLLNTLGSLSKITKKGVHYSVPV